MSKKEKGIPIQVYPSFFVFLDDPETTQEEKDDALFALKSFADGDFNYKPKTRFFRNFLPSVIEGMIKSRNKYISKSDRGKNAADIRWGNQENDANASENDANASENDANTITTTITTTTTNTPLSPHAKAQGGEAGGEMVINSNITFVDLMLQAKGAYNVIVRNCNNENAAKRFVWGTVDYGLFFTFEVRNLLDQGINCEDAVWQARQTLPPKTDKSVIASIYSMLSLSVEELAKKAESANSYFPECPHEEFLKTLNNKKDYLSKII